VILPSKHLPADRALLSIGAAILKDLPEPKTVSLLWDDLRKARRRDSSRFAVSYDWFILSLDLLCMMNAVHFEYGMIIRGRK
jgi:hypothetical protein